MITGKNYIGNQLSAKGTKSYKTFNPVRNLENTPTFFEATPGEIESALKLATNAFTAYGEMSGDSKATFLKAIADEILALDEILITTYCSESGLPDGRARGERGRTVGQLRSFAQLLEEGSWVSATIDTAQPKREPIPKPDIRKMLIPLGPVVVFGASNFPLAFSTAGGDTASALAAGCPVIVKSHPMHAGTGELVASAIIKAAERTGMPNGVFSNLNSSGIEVGAQLVKHEAVKAVGFTGSIGGGRALYNLASQRAVPIPVFAEMGSVNPVVLMPKALQEEGEKWAKTYAGSITLGTGQFCTKPGLLLGIQNQDLDLFVASLARALENQQPTPMLHQNIAGGFEQKKQKAIAQVHTTVLSEFGEEVLPNYGRQAVLAVSGTHFIESTSLHQEIFGPYALVVQCRDREELIKAIAGLEGQLTGTIIAGEDELSKSEEVITALKDKVGRLIFNGVPTGVEVCAAMHHGGPYPASTDSRFTSVGTDAIYRWVRPVSFQDCPDRVLPAALKNENPLGILRSVNGDTTPSKI